ncbi:nucleoside phosphorylase [Allomuricauda sp. SCSIO 65647]|uniref:nucleoside phosphorylase n=1 Tax=Allomuricauda sp. SCSIO 65647 TaxID=2908843 RepID=UPI001F1B9C4C|nr:nucleoside phosphorylase [Muricauda sp. SCSIO 65647]UJH67406.1 nucleoside phosphorylase [Muricauda sp. SCSIO 65647]
MAFSPSELILNADGSIYHLNLHPEDIAETIFVVGDPNRVPAISKYFDTLEVQKTKREFVTHTGYLGGKRFSVLSTGIGTGNIDIVMNELDALANIDLSTSEVKEAKKALNIIRIGTCGGLQKDIPVDTILLSETGIGLDGLLHFYDSGHVQNLELRDQLEAKFDFGTGGIRPYAFDASENLMKRFDKNRIRFGTTLTNIGFYGPQGRNLRIPPRFQDLIKSLAQLDLDGRKITNLEMETAAIYGLALLLGHNALSLNVVLANRTRGEFSSNPQQSIDTLIKYGLEHLTAS